jgi:hypothetical protein
MTEDSGIRRTDTDADSETEEPVQKTSGADELRRADERGDSDQADGEPAGAQEPPD